MQKLLKNETKRRQESNSRKPIHPKRTVVSKSMGFVIEISNTRIYLEKLLGSGLSSKVYRGNVDRNHKVAVKMYRRHKYNKCPNDMRRELKILAQLNKTENIVTAYAYGYIIRQNIYCIVMECGDISMYDVATHRYEWKHEYLTHMLRALTSLQKNNIVHMDIKPDNFIISNGIVKLIDFGLARIGPKYCTNTGGTVRYMSPEAYLAYNGFRAYISHKCDVWSLGVTLYNIIFDDFPLVWTMRNICEPPTIEFGNDSNYTIDTIKKCLSYNHNKRPNIIELV